MTEELKDIVYSDLYRFTGNKRRLSKVYLTFIQEWFSSPEFKFLNSFRRTQYYYLAKGKGLKGIKNFKNRFLFHFYNISLNHYTTKYQFQIPFETRIGKGLYIAHFGRIIIHPKSVIGHNVNISTGVIIGTQFRGARKGSPNIGNYVWIGANAVIVGNIRVGNNVLIAPGAYINFDVPDNSIVIGNPGLIRRSPGATLGYINNTILFDEYNVRSGEPTQ
jgi:serine O-acetyltransferase